MANTNSVPMGVFGPGSLFVTRTDIAGSPINIGYANDFSYDEAAESVDLFGTNQYPLLVARGTIKATGKIKIATVSGQALNQAFWGQTISTGSLLASLGETQTVSSATTGVTAFTVNVTHQSTGGNVDLGVSYTTAINGIIGLPLLQCTAGAEIVGHYSVTSSGQYNFSTTDNGLALKINYSYPTTSAGQQITVANEPIGTTPTFQLDHVSTLYGSTLYTRFYQCVSSKLTRAHSLTKFMMPEIDFGFFANQSGNVYTMAQGTAA